MWTALLFAKPLPPTYDAGMAEKTLTYRELLKRLRKFDVTEETKRGKGSERMLVRVVDGNRLSITTKCHNEGDQKPKAVIKAIRRRLRLYIRRWSLGRSLLRLILLPLQFLPQAQDA
jgi:hypothetical protein